MSIDDLIKGKYYKYIFTHFGGKEVWCFRFEGMNDNYEISVDYVLIDNHFCAYSIIDCYPNIGFEEISFKEIINYLPDKYPEKLYYLRKNKIKFLLDIKE